jgi:hypothetical protein
MGQSVTQVRINAEYLCYPTWVTRPEDGEVNPDPRHLGISEDLAAALDAWSEEFDAIFPADDPGSAAFPSAGAEAAFHDRGRGLAARVAAELPGVDVSYFDPGSGWVRAEAA